MTDLNDRYSKVVDIDIIGSILFMCRRGDSASKDCCINYLLGVQGYGVAGLPQITGDKLSTYCKSALANAKEGRRGSIGVLAACEFMIPAISSPRVIYSPTQMFSCLKRMLSEAIHLESERRSRVHPQHKDVNKAADESIGCSKAFWNKLPTVSNLSTSKLHQQVASSLAFSHSLQHGGSTTTKNDGSLAIGRRHGFKGWEDHSHFLGRPMQHRNAHVHAVHEEKNRLRPRQPNDGLNEVNALLSNQL